MKIVLLNVARGSLSISSGQEVVPCYHTLYQYRRGGVHCHGVAVETLVTILMLREVG